MSGKNLVICDSEETYAHALALYFMQKKEFMMQVQVIRKPESFIELEHEMQPDLLIMSEEYEKYIPERMSEKKVCMLSETRRISEYGKYPVVYKYQSGEEILAQIMRQCADVFCTGDVISIAGKSASKKIIGIFSPVHRIGKTAYALRMGERLAESENVLYLNLEIFGGLGGHFEECGQTISDVICYARQEQGNLGMFLASVIGHKGHLDFIAPSAVSEDMKEMSGAEWVRLISRILDESIYETVILDIDDGIPQLYQLLEICTKICVPVVDDEYAQAKIRQFEREVSFLGKEHLMKKIVKKEVKNDYSRAAS